VHERRSHSASKKKKKKKKSVSPLVDRFDLAANAADAGEQFFLFPGSCGHDA